MSSALLKSFEVERLHCDVELLGHALCALFEAYDDGVEDPDRVLTGSFLARQIVDKAKALRRDEDAKADAQVAAVAVENNRRLQRLVHEPALDPDAWTTPLRLLAHRWRLRRIRRAMRVLDRRLATYERAYGLPPFASVSA